MPKINEGKIVIAPISIKIWSGNEYSVLSPFVFTFNAGSPLSYSFANTGLLVQKIINAKIIKNFKGEFIKFFEYFFIINSFYVMQEDLIY